MTLVTVSTTEIVDTPANDVWNTLRAFVGNEKFNPLVTSSVLEGSTTIVAVGSKRICHVSLYSGKNILRTEEVVNSLDDTNRTMTYTVISAPETPFEGLVNKIEVSSSSDNICEVTFTGTMGGKDDLDMESKKRILDETYHKILNGLKNLHEGN
jgi:hypothetical protein